MPVYQLDERLVFPPVEHAEDGLLAVGGDLSPERLILAYSLGIFPWYDDGQPILWHSPDPRMVLVPEGLHISKTLRRTLRQGRFRVTADTVFDRVVRSCAAAPRAGQRGTWITKEMRRSYLALHRMGLAHSVETWVEDDLVGGLYGVSLGGAFFGESMFSAATDASKIALATLGEQLRAWEFSIIDCQVRTEHLASFGAVEWPRERFIAALRDALHQPTRKGRWRLAAATQSLPG